jgi:hypothetical protein
MTIERPMFPPVADERCQIIQFSTAARVSPKRHTDAAIVAAVDRVLTQRRERPLPEPINRHLQKPAHAAQPARCLVGRGPFNAGWIGIPRLSVRNKTTLQIPISSQRPKTKIGVHLSMRGALRGRSRCLLPRRMWRRSHGSGRNSTRKTSALRI